MGWKQWFEKKHTLIGRVTELQQSVGLLTERISEMQTSYKERVASTANPYKTAESQVQEIIDKFNGESDFGCELVQRIINLLAAFTLPNGLDLIVDESFKGKTKSDTGQPERDYLAKWLDDNNLNEGGTLKLAQEANMQGQVALTFEWKKAAKGSTDEGRVICTYQNWVDTSFVIEPVAASNLFGPYKMTYIPEGKDERKVLPDNKFVWLAVNSRFGKTEGRPRIGGILHILEYLSMELADWRKSNELFGHPTPCFECKDAAEVLQVKNYIKDTNWRVGQAIATTSKLDLKVPTGAAAASKELITCLIQIISSTTGISPHFLGFPNLMSNRATAESMGEPMEIVSKSEMALWSAFYDAMFDKVIRMRNANVDNNRQLREGVVKAKLLPLSDRQWKQIKEVWLPLLKESAISLQTFLSKLPNIDDEVELERLKSQTVVIGSEEEEIE